MLAPDRDKIGTGLSCQPGTSGRVAQCPGCWPKRLPWHWPCVYSRRAKWKKKTPETLFQAHGIQWSVDAKPFVRHRLSAVWCGGETGKPVVGSARAGYTLPPNDAAFQGSQLREGGRGGPTVGGRGLDGRSRVHGPLVPLAPSLALWLSCGVETSDVFKKSTRRTSSYLFHRRMYGWTRRIDCPVVFIGPSSWCLRRVHIVSRLLPRKGRVVGSTKKASKHSSHCIFMRDAVKLAASGRSPLWKRDGMEKRLRGRGTPHSDLGEAPNLADD